MITNDVDAFLNLISDMEVAQQSKLIQKQMLDDSVVRYEGLIKEESVKLETVREATALLQDISNKSTSQSYKTMEAGINKALKIIFPDKVRQIELVESTRGQYPQLMFKLYTENGVVRSLKTGTGHGIAQLISLISNLSLICITGGRRFVALDEVVSGMSGNTKSMLDYILYDFASIGFQFVIVEHGYIPKGAQVYVFESNNGVGEIVNEYIEANGVYSEGKRVRRGYAKIVESNDSDVITQGELSSSGINYYKEAETIKKEKDSIDEI